MSQSLLIKYSNLLYRKINDEFIIYNILNDINRISIKEYDKLFIFSQRGMGFHRKLYLILAHALSKKDFPSIFLFKDDFLGQYIPKNVSIVSKYLNSFNPFFKGFNIHQYFPELIIDGMKIDNSLIEKVSKITITNGEKRQLYFDWDIRLKDEIAQAKGVNCFPLIRTTNRVVFKRYNIDFSNDKVISISNRMVKSLDLLMKYFFLIKKFSKKHNIKSRIVGWEYNYLPNNFFRLICDTLSENRDVEYIDVNRGYKHYFGIYFRHTYLSAINLTYLGIQNRNSVSRDKVKYNLKNINKKQFEKPIKKVFKKPKTKNEISDDQKPIIEKCNLYKNENKNVFVLFAHLFYDNPVFDQTDTFHDMCDWIAETINYFKETDDLLLLKPHPKENRPNEPQKEPNETLKSFVTTHFHSLPHNIILLEPNMFKLYDLIPHMTCGLIWKSSASNELTYLEIPCIISGPTPFNSLSEQQYVKNRKHYHNLLKNANKMKVNEKQKLEIAAYLYELYHKDTHVQELLYDKKHKLFHYNKEKVFEYLKSGDKAIDKLVNDMIN